MHPQRLCHAHAPPSSHSPTTRVLPSTHHGWVVVHAVHRSCLVDQFDEGRLIHLHDFLATVLEWAKQCLVSIVIAISAHTILFVQRMQPAAIACACGEGRHLRPIGPDDA